MPAPYACKSAVPTIAAHARTFAPYCPEANCAATPCAKKISPRGASLAVVSGSGPSLPWNACASTYTVRVTLWPAPTISFTSSSAR